jgi:hypothetical protein
MDNYAALRWVSYSPGAEDKPETLWNVALWLSSNHHASSSSSSIMRFLASQPYTHTHTQGLLGNHLQ